MYFYVIARFVDLSGCDMKHEIYWRNVLEVEISLHYWRLIKKSKPLKGNGAKWTRLQVHFGSQSLLRMSENLTFFVSEPEALSSILFSFLKFYESIICLNGFRQWKLAGGSISRDTIRRSNRIRPGDNRLARFQHTFQYTETRAHGESPYRGAHFALQRHAGSLHSSVTADSDT